MWDERLSTQRAEEILRSQGRNLRRMRERGEIDAVAAAVILQDYLDNGSADPTPVAPGEKPRGLED
jgi:RNase H-fold protein (predicted Holliday junction resolvase)